MQMTKPVAQLTPEGYFAFMTEADRSPADIEEVWLIPGGCVDAPAPSDMREGYRYKWGSNGWIEEKIPDPEPEPEPTLEDKIRRNTAALQRAMDLKAQERGYDSIFTAVSYAGTAELEDPMAARFQAEGNAYKAWRSAVWAKSYAYLAEVQDSQGEIPLPTPEESVAMMPELVLP